MKLFFKTTYTICVLSTFGIQNLEANSEKSYQHPISIKLNYCLKRSSSTLEISQCFETAQKEWDMALNVIYKKLLNAIQDNDLKESLKEIQRNWILSRDKQFLFIHKLYNLTGGSISIINEIASRTKIIKDRVSELTNIYKNISHIIREED